MSGRVFSIGLLTVTLICPQAALAAQSPEQQEKNSQHIADASVLKRAVASKVSTDRENRQVVKNLLDRRDVRAVAGKMGLDVKRAQTAVTSLEGAQLADLAALARDAERDLAGGNKTVTLSITTLLLLLILIVLIVD